VLSGAVGAVGIAALTVHEGDTARALSSGDLLVLGTPRVLALAEAATVAALAEWLDEGQTSVGVRASIDHSAACGIGADVRAVAVCTGVEGRTITFTCDVYEGERVLATVVVDRVVVDGVRFMARVAAQGVLNDK
jgi:fluoroacetyl-CoA thioesterase